MTYLLTNLQRMKHKKRRQEVRDWKEVQEKLEQRQLRQEKNLKDYLKIKGELD